MQLVDITACFHHLESYDFGKSHNVWVSISLLCETLLLELSLNTSASPLHWRTLDFLANAPVS